MSEQVRDAVKDALRMMPYGFYSITSRAGDEVNAMVANWVVQCSFEPRLITLALARDAYSHGLITKGRAFAVNIFNKADAELVKPLSKGRGKKPDKMKDVRYTPAPVTGCPILEGVAAYVECKVIHVFETGGDHDLVVGEVVGAKVFKPGEAAQSLTLPDIGWSYAG